MRRWIGGHAHVAKVVLVAVMALLVASCQWVNGLRADHSIELAHRLFQTGHFLQAAEQYEDVLAKDPTRVEAITSWRSRMTGSTIGLSRSMMTRSGCCAWPSAR